MKKYIKVGLIQPVIDPDRAWGSKKPFFLNVDHVIGERIWNEINTGLIEMLRIEDKPDIILIPELHLPVARIATIKRLSKSHGVMIIAGIDFQSRPGAFNKIRNRGIICIPNGLGTALKSTRIHAMQFGKTYFTYMERDMFKDIQSMGACEEDPEQYMYIFKSSELGDFGIMICSDIFDIERMMLYQGRIHHLFIISLNKDHNTYQAMAESLTRLLYCNVVICNTGFYGGSMAVSPYSEPNDRTIYKYTGQRMFNTHVIKLPLDELNYAQHFTFRTDNKKDIKFKATPPGYHRYDSRSDGIHHEKKKGND